MFNIKLTVYFCMYEYYLGDTVRRAYEAIKLRIEIRRDKDGALFYTDLTDALL